MVDCVLVTGVSGFLGGHVAFALLNAGYAVRGSVRDLARADGVRAVLSAAGADTDPLSFVALDLSSDSGWSEAAEGCRFVIHTASPFTLQMPKDRREMVQPAVDGTERAVVAALQACAERIVLTSSMAAIAYGHSERRDTPFTAADWTNPEAPGVNAYQESKTRAERRAWALVDRVGQHERLVTINPCAIFGPLLDDDPGTSALIVKRLLDGSIPAIPRLPITAVDVRDVAAVHVAALTAPEAGGQRLPMAAGTIWAADLARTLRATFPRHRVPRLVLPDWAVILYGLFNREVGDNVRELGVIRRLDSTLAERLLGQPMISAEESLLATAQSLVARGLV